VSNAATLAISAANKFREVTRQTESPTTKLLAEGLTHLSEAVRELHQELGAVESRVKALSNE
jgi:translation initiation factor 2B subunit (eIF-2B alpha/beta/delta family)